MKQDRDFFYYLGIILALVGLAIGGLFCGLAVRVIQNTRIDGIIVPAAQKMGEKKGCPCYERVP